VSGKCRDLVGLIPTIGWSAGQKAVRQIAVSQKLAGRTDSALLFRDGELGLTQANGAHAYDDGEMSPLLGGSSRLDHSRSIGTWTQRR
jgi:hypothetical protein